MIELVLVVPLDKAWSDSAREAAEEARHKSDAQLDHLHQKAETNLSRLQKTGTPEEQKKAKEIRDAIRKEKDVRDLMRGQTWQVRETAAMQRARW